MDSPDNSLHVFITGAGAHYARRARITAAKTAGAEKRRDCIAAISNAPNREISIDETRSNGCANVCGGKKGSNTPVNRRDRTLRAQCAAYATLTVSFSHKWQKQ